MVMPLLLPVDSPHLETVKEIIKFTNQILEETMNHLASPAPDSCIFRDLHFSAKRGWHIGSAEGWIPPYRTSLCD